MAKNSNTVEEISSSVSSIYAGLLEKRKIEREEKEAKRLKEYEEKQREKEEKYKKEDGTKMSKKERRESELASWQNVIVGLTGDDLEYTKEKKSKKKKYRQWIDDETDGNTVITEKPRKKKKKNYQKEFEPELHMLKTIVTEQNKFTADLQKRFQNAAGPSTKDAAPLNKTLVELAGTINASRQNSLGLLREIGNLKKNIADLYFKQLKADAESSGGGFNSQDIGLMGSNIASSIFPDEGIISSPVAFSAGESSPTQQDHTINFNSPEINITPNTPDIPTSVSSVDNFDPSSWEGPQLTNTYAMYENIPHSVVVEWHKEKDIARFKAIRDDNGEELVGCPVPTSDPSKLKFNEKDLTVKGEFDETYKLEIV